MRWFCARALWDASRGYRTSRLRLVVHSSVHSSASRDMDVLGWLGRVLDPVKEETSSRMDGESAGSRGVDSVGSGPGDGRVASSRLPDGEASPTSASGPAVLMAPQPAACAASDASAASVPGQGSSLRTRSHARLSRADTLAARSTHQMLPANPTERTSAACPPPSRPQRLCNSKPFMNKLPPLRRLASASGSAAHRKLLDELSACRAQSDAARGVATVQQPLSMWRPPRPVEVKQSAKAAAIQRAWRRQKLLLELSDGRQGVDDGFLRWFREDTSSQSYREQMSTETHSSHRSRRDLRRD